MQMVKFETDVRIARAPEDVFRYVTAVERIPEWQSQAGVKRVDRSSPEPLRPGSEFTMRRESGRGTATIECEVTAVDAPKRFDFHSIDSDGFVGDFATTLTRNGDGTTGLHWAVDMRPPNLLYRVLSPMIRREIRKSALVDFENLKRILESGPPARPGTNAPTPSDPSTSQPSGG